LAPDYREDTLFQVGRAYEIATADDPWRVDKPQVLR
jgi:hypothetical protein